MDMCCVLTQTSSDAKSIPKLPNSCMQVLEAILCVWSTISSVSHQQNSAGHIWILRKILSLLLPKREINSLGSDYSLYNMMRGVTVLLRASLVAQTVKNLPAVQETWVWSLSGEDPLEKEMATHSSILAWIIPWTEEPGRLQSMGSQRVGHDWVTNTFRHRQ